MPNGFNSTTPSHIPNAVKIMGSLAVGTDASPNAVATSTNLQQQHVQLQQLILHYSNGNAAGPPTHGPRPPTPGPPDLLLLAPDLLLLALDPLILAPDLLLLAPDPYSWALAPDLRLLPSDLILLALDLLLLALDPLILAPDLCSWPWTP